MPRITNEVLDEKINNLTVTVGEIKDHLIKLNGSVAKNTGDIRVVRSFYTWLVPVLMMVMGYLVNSVLHR